MDIRGFSFEVLANGWVHIALPLPHAAMTLSPKEWAAVVKSIGEAAEHAPLAPT